MAEAVAEPGMHPQHVMNTSGMCRTEKRKAIKKMKRRQLRKDAAEKERQEEDMRLKNPEEQRRIEIDELKQKERKEMELKLFEEREKEWIQAIELKKKIDEEKEEQRRRDLEEESMKQQAEVESKDEFADECWEYIEEGPAEIIWQGNEITVKKKRIRVLKKDIDLNRNKEGSSQSLKSEDADRPTSNPFPPDSEAYAADLSTLSAQALIENVGQQVPHFGTEQDKAHCPFHLKTGACRFGPRCSRVHFYPDKSHTLLVKNMYTGPGLAWEQDEGLEFMDEEIERCYEEFYEDVHTEFLKFGEIINFKVCKNGSFHLRGNVYVHYRFLDSAASAFLSLNGRFFAGKQITCEFVNLTRWKVAICGEYMKSRFKTCSHGTACNFIHCFRNPSGDYEWADIDKPPPRYWIIKMATLFSYSDELLDEMLMEADLNTRGTTADGDSYHSRRSRSRETGWGRRNDNDRRNQHSLRSDEKADREEHVKGRRKSEKYVTDSDEQHAGNRNRHQSLKRKSPSGPSVEINSTINESYCDMGWSEEDVDMKIHHHPHRRRWRCRDEDSISAGRNEDRSKSSRLELNVGSGYDGSSHINNSARGKKFWVDGKREEADCSSKRPDSSSRYYKTRKGSDGNGSRKDKTSKRGEKFRQQGGGVELCGTVGKSEKDSSGCLMEAYERWMPEGVMEAFE